MNLSETIKSLSILGEVRVRYNEYLDCFQADIKGVETKTDKNSCILAGTWGKGVTAEDAIFNYRDALKGKTVVVNAMSDNRKEYIVI